MASVDRDRKAFEIFGRLCDVPKEHRADVLAEACGDDTELKQIVEKLLAADVSGDEGSRVDAIVDDFLVQKVREIQPEPPPPASAMSDRGGQYRIIRVIGEGGMGTVYEAEQSNPRRRVAIKAIRSGLRSPSLRRRFEYEAQVLARLEHAGIARLYEADTRSGDESVQAYLAMEFVDGLPMDEYADQHRLDTRRKLQLFLRLCDPIEYAHRVGVIHRDLKPANIFVQPDGNVKVLDFGVARSIHDHSQSMATMTGQFVGTLAYMSPEQIESAGEIDTRADVYALGVILYKLLAGRLPIDVRQDGLLTGSRRVREEKPPMLGTIARPFRGDLEIIAAKALEKDRDRRYASVADLAHDIENFLAGRAITARADSTWYIVRKALWRYRAAVSVATFFFVLLGLFAIYASIIARRNADLAIAAQTSQRDADLQLIETRRSLYFSSIGFAQSALENDDMERAHAQLEKCDPALRNWEWSYLRRLCDLSASTLDLKIERPRYVSRSADDNLISMASLSREVLLFDQREKRELLRTSVEDGFARAAVSLDGKWFAYGGVVQKVVLMDVATRQQRVLDLQVPPVADPNDLGMRILGFTPDAKSLITGGIDRKVRVWDVETATLRLTLDLGRALPLSMLVDPAGHFVCVGDNEHNIRLFNLQTGELIRTLSSHDAPVWSLAMSPDGHWLASGDNDARVIVWDLATWHIVAQRDTNDGWFTAMGFSPDSGTLAIGRADATIHLLHLPEAASSGVLRGHRHAIVQLDWKPDGMLESFSLDGTMKRWTPESALQVPTINTRQPQTIGLTFTPDSKGVIAGGSDGTIRSYRLDGLEKNQTPIESTRFADHSALVLEVAVDAAHQRIASAGHDGEVHISDIRTGETLFTLNPKAGRIPGLDFSPDGNSLLVAAVDGVSLWDLSTGQKVRDYVIDKDRVAANEVRFDHTGKTFYAACSDGHLKQWRVDQAEEIRDVAIDRSGLYDIRLSPDGTLVAVAGDTSSVAVLDAQSLAVLHEYKGHQGPVHGIAFHPNGKRLASCGNDRSVRVWDIDSATELVSLRGHRRLVQHVEFSADGTTLASSSDDGTVRLWRAEVPE